MRTELFHRTNRMNRSTKKEVSRPNDKRLVMRLKCLPSRAAGIHLFLYVSTFSIGKIEKETARSRARKRTPRHSSAEVGWIVLPADKYENQFLRERSLLISRHKEQLHLQNIFAVSFAEYESERVGVPWSRQCPCSFAGAWAWSEESESSTTNPESDYVGLEKCWMIHDPLWSESCRWSPRPKVISRVTSSERKQMSHALTIAFVHESNKRQGIVHTMGNDHLHLSLLTIDSIICSSSNREMVLLVINIL